MTALELIGSVGAALLHDRLDGATVQDGTARFMLDRLKGDEVAAIVSALLNNGESVQKVSIRIPRELAAGHGLPDDVLTDERTVALRNSDWPTAALLIANTDDDQGASLHDVSPVGAKTLTSEATLWVSAASRTLPLSDADREVWQHALAGLNGAGDWSLRQIANYVALTEQAIEQDSKPLLDALGWALPALQLPRDSAHFLSLRDKDKRSPAKWKRLFTKLLSDRRPLLVKQRKSGQLIDSEDLRVHWETVKDVIQPSAHKTIEAFLTAPPRWTPQVEALAELEWEADGVIQLFSGLRQTRMSLAEETLEFYEYSEVDLSDRLTEADRQYLEQLKKSKQREPRDDDRDFFEMHREELARNRSLRAKWERFVYGKAIECTDFLDGLLAALERLHGQATNLTGPRTLEIRSSKRTKGQWLELNADVATAFSLQYQGLQALTGPNVHWDTPHLFAYEQLLEKARTKKKYRRNESTARASIQIKFDISLKVGQGASADTTTVQVQWQGDPDAIGTELPDDLQRLENRHFLAGTVARQAVSRKGALQSVSLFDVTTLEPAFGRDSGSLIPKIAGTTDLARKFTSALKEAVATARIATEAATRIEEAWLKFEKAYGDAIKSWRTEGLSSHDFILQLDAYGELLEALAAHAPGDLNRQNLWHPLLAIGTVPVTGGPPAAIIAPWHPLRMAALAVKARAVAGLIGHVLTADQINFGDPRLFFSDLRSEIAHPWYPEVAVGFVGVEPVLLAEACTLNGYSLMERPVLDPSEAATDVDPREGAREIRTLIERYLELQPHERSNLSIMLYNCDAAGLPLETVNALGTLHEDGEVHCNVLVRHRDRAKLSRVYGDLLERSESDPDALVISETSRNFMSKLRIGVMLSTATGTTSGNYREVDIAFLHDVVSRQAKQAWIGVSADPQLLDIHDHVPARWSYRLVSSDAQLKATNFLVCPRQPRPGWAYLDTVAAVVEQKSIPQTQHRLPARQISFQDHVLKEMFDEVHRLAEWVATYDDLLDKQQLKAQGINVIRYRRKRTHGRNIVVSSTSELSILHVLVRKRLAELGLGLPEDRIAALSNRLVEDALAISGDIVLRAAKRGVSAGELIGLVLSRALVAEELGQDAAAAWFLLDDYALWLGQKEQGIADILALSVDAAEDGNFKLRVVVTEAKYISAQQCADARRTSSQQLRQTVARIEDALFGDPGRLDRDLWLSRIADLLLDSAQPLASPEALELVRDGIRKGTVPIDLRGYSHVFVAHPADGGAVEGDQLPIKDLSNGLQEVFSRQQLRALVSAYEAHTSLIQARRSLGDLQPWTEVNFREPAPRVNWTLKSDGVAAPRQPAAKGPPPKKPDLHHHTPPASPAATSVEAAAGDLDDYEEEKPALQHLEAAAKDPADRFAALVAAKASQQLAETEAEEAWLQATEQKLRSALIGYGLQAKAIGRRLTPNAALIRFAGSDRLGVEAIEGRRSALLTTHGLRVVAISPLPGEIVVAIARPQRQTVSLWDLWARRQLNVNSAGLNTSFMLGLKELDGEILYLNLGSAFAGEQQHEPHSLIAGATGSGKSVLIQALILDIAATNPSRFAHIYLIDPKMGVDYAAIERLPHLQGGIIVDQAAASEVLERMVAEMDRRYELFRSCSARDLKTYNEKVAPLERLPMIFIVHDEFAEWMLTDTYRDAVAQTVQRLGVKARAAGIHLIFAAQRPDANVLPVQLRDNLGNRLILKVASVGTSEIALGMKGAESLLGLGHLAARLNGVVSFAQAPFLSDPDIDAAVEAISLADQASAGKPHL